MVCYDRKCPFHSCNFIKDDGPFCDEDKCWKYDDNGNKILDEEFQKIVKGNKNVGCKSI
jgi:hypothetical protein